MTWLIAFSIKAAMLLSAAGVAAFLLRRSSADVRHRLWLAALIGVAIVALPVSLPQPVRIAVPVQFFISTLGAELPVRARSGAWSLWSAVWIAGIALSLLRLAAGIATVAFWTRGARHVNRARMSVWISDLAATPLTWGVIRPVILFPASAAEWPEEQLELALRHEQAHVARRDWLWQMLAQAVNAVFWFHPLVWMANAQLRREAENATDDMVLTSGADPADYAAQLVRVARRISGGLPLGVVPMVRNNVLETRVRGILDPLRRRAQASLSARAAVAVFAVALLVPLLAYQQKTVVIAAAAQSAQQSPALPALVPAAQPAPVKQIVAAAVDPAPAPGPFLASEPGLTLPQPIYRVEPQYTEDAKAARLQGSVLLGLVVDEQGRAQDIQVLRSVDPGLDQQAVEAVRQWQFSPGMKDGSPVAVKANIEVNFRLL